jgi:hypothetical protein
MDEVRKDKLNESPLWGAKRTSAMVTISAKYQLRTKRSGMRPPLRHVDMLETKSSGRLFRR